MPPEPKSPARDFSGTGYSSKKEVVLGQGGGGLGLSERAEMPRKICTEIIFLMANGIQKMFPSSKSFFL